MQDRIYALCGMVGPLVTCSTLVFSAALGFDWGTHALSDLGHAVQSPVAPVFNFGLLLSGFLIIVYAATVFRKHAPFTSHFLLISGFMVQLVAAFDEVYGVLHYGVAVAHFLMLTVTSAAYTVERRSRLALITLVVTLSFWLVYSTGLTPLGIAVPEMASKIVLAWVVYSAYKIYTG